MDTSIAKRIIALDGRQTLAYTSYTETDNDEFAEKIEKEILQKYYSQIPLVERLEDFIDITTTEEDFKQGLVDCLKSISNSPIFSEEEIIFFQDIFTKWKLGYELDEIDIDKIVEAKTKILETHV